MQIIRAPDSRDLGREFLADSAIRGRLSPRTARVYASVTSAFLRWLERERGHDAAEITRETIEAYLRHLLATDARNRGTLRQPSTVHRVLKALRHFCGYLVERRVLATNPTEGVRGPKFKERLIDPLSRDEIGKLVRAADAIGTTPVIRTRNRALIWLVADLGLRIDTEALALDRADVEASDGSLREVLLLGAKGRERAVPLTAAARPALAEYLALRTDADPALFVSHYHRSRGSRRRDRIAWAAARNMLKKTAVAAGLDPRRVSWHGLRRTSATEAVENGMSWPHLKAAYGWSRVETAFRYVHSAATRSAVEAFRKSSLLTGMVRDGRLAAAAGD